MITPELIERVESGAGADDALDGLIFDAMSRGPVGSAREAVLDRRTRPNWLPRYTTSLDAVVALIEAKLPGWDWDVSRIGGESEARITDNKGLFLVQGDTERFGRNASPARALLAAALRALQETRND